MGNAVPDGAQGTVRSYVMRLRQALDTAAATGPIVTCPQGYCIDLSGDVLDLHRFEALAWIFHRGDGFVSRITVLSF
jgi:DNA-binding SARP family transcriptional activator